MQMKITEAEDRVWTLQQDYCHALKVAGYGDVVMTKPHNAIKHITSRLKPHYLQKIMRGIIH